MQQTAKRMIWVLAVLVLGACSSDDIDAPSPQQADAPLSGPPQTRFELANRCLAMKSAVQNTYAVRAEDGTYAATAATVAEAEPFFMKPTALGKYLIYSRNAETPFLAVDGAGVGSAEGASDDADWTLLPVAVGGLFTVLNETAQQALVVDATSGQFGLTEALNSASVFSFDEASGCGVFPEAELNITGKTYKGRGANQPALGFADVHQHVSATDFLGNAHYGRPFHRFGITHALENCEILHGPDGTLDVVGNFLGAGVPLATHDTVGWPTFTDWPARDSLMHESMYYKWIERTYKAGLRLMVNNLVENELLCTLQSKAPTSEPGVRPQNCNEMDNAIAQVQFMRDMQDYIDAQEGGPGKGWFRIVTSPFEARLVIDQGKLAVVLGIEISHLFDCNVRYLVGGVEVPGCTEAGIDNALNELYNLGVRQMFPIHEFDNAFGGNGIFDGLVLNFGNFGDTGQFWKTYDCPTTDTSGGFSDYFFTPGAEMATADPSGVLPAIFGPGAAFTQVPIYPTARQCNARAITDLGAYAIRKIMEKKVILEIDHLELAMKTQVMDMAAEQSPPYPVVSTHGGHGGISNEQARRILSLGGIIYPGGNTNGRGFVNTLNQQRALQSPDFLAMGFGADTNGLATQAGPRGAGAVPVQYPFTLFQGPGWGAKFTGISPLVFDKQKTGERVYDINEGGWAHYGLAADFVEEVRLEGGEPALNALYDSAEAYLRMWEKTVNR